jgi:hypothetical protein
MKKKKLNLPLHYITGSKSKEKNRTIMYLAFGIIMDNYMYVTVPTFESIVKIKGSDNEGFICLN